jgi:[acyl-carrier-protein] S-malonyltransferase
MWTSCIKAMVDAAISTTLECGPGKVLSGLSKRIDRSLVSFNIENPAGLEKALSEI